MGATSAGSRAPRVNKMTFVTPDVISGLSGVGVRLVVRTEPGFPAVVADAAPVALNPSSPWEFRVETTADLRTLCFGVANDLGTFVGILSIILLALATISASTTMYLSVQSRAQEIALRRAIGSSRSAIARLFVAEGLLIGATRRDRLARRSGRSIARCIRSGMDADSAAGSCAPRHRPWRRHWPP